MRDKGFKVALYSVGGGRRGRYIADSMRAGLKQHGIPSVVCTKFNGVVADMAIAYGWIHQVIFRKYREAGKQFAYFDLGYWHRRPSKMPTDGYYRLAVNDWDTAANMRRGCPPDRFRALGIKVAPPRNGKLDENFRSIDTLLITGMSEKAARTHGFQKNRWEKEMRERLIAMRSHNYRILIRPKPTKKVSLPPIEDELRRAWLLVTHHSNTAIDALVAGVPFYAEKGVGALLSPKELTPEFIKSPTFPDEAERMQLLYDTAYAQWKPQEMQRGEAWEHIRGLL